MDAAASWLGARGAVGRVVRHRLDILHSPDFIAPLRGAGRHVITVHDLSFIHYPEYMTAASRRYYNGQIEASIRRADHILAVSDATKKDLMDILDVPVEMISVQYHGVDASFQPLPADETGPVLEALALPETYFLFVGTLEPRKNLVGLAKAYRDLKDLKFPMRPSSSLRDDRAGTLINSWPTCPPSESTSIC